jgi:cytochrome c-type biogenesis protein CcmH
MNAMTDPAARVGPGRLAALAAFAVAVAAAGYAYKGVPSQLIGRAAPTAVAADEAQGSNALPPEALAEMAAMTDQLAARMKEKPDDPVGWTMLGRSQAALGRYGEAVASFKRAATLKPGDAGLLVDWADSLAMSQGQKLDGEPLALIDQALKIDPNHLKGLSLAGAAAFVNKDYLGALKHWEKLVAVAPPDDEFAGEMRGAVAQARQLAGLPPAPAGTAAAATPKAQAPTNAAAASASSVSGRVSISGALAKQVAPTDTVFISARPAEGGSRMPLAVLRVQAKDLPMDFTLDDSLAMSPTAKLSSSPRVVVTARVSASGQAMPKPEDLGAQSKPVELGTKGVALEIAGPIGR